MITNFKSKILFFKAAEKHALEENHYNFMKKMVQILTGTEKTCSKNNCIFFLCKLFQQVAFSQIFMEYLLVAFIFCSIRTQSYFKFLVSSCVVFGPRIRRVQYLTSRYIWTLLLRLRGILARQSTCTLMNYGSSSLGI